MIASTPTTTGLLAHALQYARHGWRVLPVGVTTSSPEGKAPLIKDWVRLATTEEATVTDWWSQWPDANIGIATGWATGLLVVDIDPRNGGLETVQHLEAEGKALPDTWMVRTGGGGIHAYYLHPGEVGGNPKQPLKAQGVEFKGDGGQVLAAGSVNRVTGARYEAFNELPIVAAPDWLVAMAWPPREPVAAATLPALPVSADAQAKWAAQAFKAELDTLQRASKGTRNETLNTAAYSLGQLVGGGYLDRATVEHELTRVAQLIGLEKAETRATIASGLNSGARQPRRYVPRLEKALEGHFKNNTEYMTVPQSTLVETESLGGQKGGQTGGQKGGQKGGQRNGEIDQNSSLPKWGIDKNANTLQGKHYVVLQACWDWVEIAQIMRALGLKSTEKNIKYYRPKFITPLLEAGYIERKYPMDSGTREKQAYRITPAGDLQLKKWLQQRQQEGVDAASIELAREIIKANPHSKTTEKLSTQDLTALIYHLEGDRLACEANTRDGLLFEYLDAGYYRLLMPGVQEEAFIASFDVHSAVKKNRIKEVLHFLKMKLGLRHIDWNTMPSPWCIPFSNGILDTAHELPVLHAHDKSHRLTAITPTYWDPTARAPKFEAFLKSCFAGLPDADQCCWLVYEYLGYCLLPKPFHKKFLYLCGVPDSGKSLLAMVFEALIGAEFTMPIALRDLDSNFIGSYLFNKKLALCSEPPAKAVLNDGALKSWTGNDPQKVEFKGKQPFNWEHTVRFLMVGNSVPSIEDNTDATVGRILMLPFLNRVPANQRNPFLLEELKEELPGIAYLAVAGAMNLRENGGFTQPPSGLTYLSNEIERRKPTYGQSYFS